MHGRPRVLRPRLEEDRRLDAVPTDFMINALVAALAQLQPGWQQIKPDLALSAWIDD